MTETPAAQQGRAARTFAEAEDALLSRWPETRLEPSLDRIQAFVDFLGDPQKSYRVIHLTGTNGKTTTARIIDTLIRAMDLRTGRFTSPHVEKMSERISIDGEPLSDEAFVRAFNDVAPYTHLVDESQEFPLSFFEAMVGMAYAAFADAPVDVAVIEVGMGGTWDATNVADGEVAVITPIGLDHMEYLGDTVSAIASEKAGIIKPGATVVMSEQEPEALEVLLARADEVGATVLRDGVDFEVLTRTPAVGGQVISLRGLRSSYDDVFLPLYGEHQAHNAVLALAAVEAFIGHRLGEDLVQAAFAEVTSPGRLEVIRASPMMILDAAHNPHGAAATARALEDSFAVSPLIGVVSVMGDKDAEGLLAAFEPHLDDVVITQNSQPRAMRAAALADIATELFGEDRVHLITDFATALDFAAGLADSGGNDSLSTGAVLVTGSVVTVGEARHLLLRRDPEQRLLARYAAADEARAAQDAADEEAEDDDEDAAIDEGDDTQDDL
jgi:dihydrofolate synthase/folylpolyglutamate synthase